LFNNLSERVPALTDLAQGIEEHHLARLVRMPVLFAAQLGDEGLFEWLKQRGDHNAG
jgi:hypothetical protein